MAQPRAQREYLHPGRMQREAIELREELQRTERALLAKGRKLARVGQDRHFVQSQVAEAKQDLQVLLEVVKAAAKEHAERRRATRPADGPRKLLPPPPASLYDLESLGEIDMEALDEYVSRAFDVLADKSAASAKGPLPPAQECISPRGASPGSGSRAPESKGRGNAARVTPLGDEGMALKNAIAAELARVRTG